VQLQLSIIVKFKAKMHQIRFWLNSAPYLTGGAYSTPPDLLGGFKGAYFKGEGVVGKGRGGREGAMGEIVQF